MKLKHVFLAVITATLFATSCSSDDDSSSEPRGDFENGILVLNQGNFNDGNASLDFIGDDGMSSSNIFDSVNNSLLGDIAQSVAFNDAIAYIVVNNSQKVEVVNRYTFESIATIDTGLDNPRYMTFANGKGYITNWGGFVAVIDLETQTVSSTIPVESGPEQIIANGSNLYVSHKGGFGSNNKISVIDAASNSVVTTITVNDLPDEMLFDAQGNLVVLCEGATLFDENFNVIGHTTASISTIDLGSNTVSNTVEFANELHPSSISVEGNDMYYVLSGSVYKTTTAATQLPTEAFFTPAVSSFIYGFATENGAAYICDANFSGASQLHVYDLSSGTNTATHTAGVGTSAVYFN